MRTAIVGGGAAGFFLAVALKEMCPGMQVCILERSQHVLAKVKVSGGGRCNCTNTFAQVTDLASVYPRGHRLMKRLLRSFSQRDAYEWFERHGVRLTTQADECVFPASQDSQTIIDCFLREAHRHHVEIRTGTPVSSLSQLADFDFVAVTTGGQPRLSGLQWLGHPVEPPVPSLFTFAIADEQLHQLMGTVADHATVMIPGTRLRAEGPLLVTHWGMSGPAVLRLSSYAARLLHDADYRLPLSVNWTSHTDDDVLQQLLALATAHPQKQVASAAPLGLSLRLWGYLANKYIGTRAQGPWGSLNKKEANRLVHALTNDTYQLAGRAAFRDEFVTCGGVSLAAVHPATLESRTVPRLYFAGEVLDIDGVTGGFNFQAAWTTAYTVAQAISRACSTDGTP